MNKIVVIINGSGGVGKDTLCDFAASFYRTKNISSITPIKDIASQCGWQGEKDEKSRKFLADLKRIFVAYNDLPCKYLVEEYKKFLEDNNEILFVHIREGEEIQKFKQCIEIPCITLLIRRKKAEEKVWGNQSDDRVEDYPYDYYYDNDKELSEASDDFKIFMQRVFRETCS